MNIDIKKQIEFGDFQTPQILSDKVCKIIKGYKYETVVEPNCGLGHFLFSCIKCFPRVNQYYGFDINKQHIKLTKSKLRKDHSQIEAHIEEQDFFKKDWDVFFKKTKKPILVIGNPPWVTNSKIGLIKGDNLPQKTNFLKHKGFDALTGKSNFDISEWMLIKLVNSLVEKEATLAMVIKSSVARKVLKHCWSNDLQINDCSIYFIDSKSEFNVSVDACVFVCNFGKKVNNKKCLVFKTIGLSTSYRRFACW
jgi:type I restriction-modification system DNA methylase subunit